MSSVTYPDPIYPQQPEMRDVGLISPQANFPDQQGYQRNGVGDVKTTQGRQAITQQQPQATPVMDFRKAYEGRENDWQHGLFRGYQDLSTCIYSCFCPSLSFGRNKKRSDYLERNGQPDPDHGGLGCGEECCIHVALDVFCHLGWVLQLGPRANLRARHNIHGDYLHDCLATFLCTPCTLTQESRQIQAEEDLIGSGRPFY